MASDLLRNMYKSSRPPLPSPLQHPITDLPEDVEAEELEDESMDSFSADLATTMSFQDPTPAIHPSKNPAVFSVSSRYGPLEWSSYFEEKKYFKVTGESVSESDITFNVYETRGRPGAPLFVMHHGAGSGALGFALAAKEIRAIVGMDASILCFDARGHGTPLGMRQLLADDWNPWWLFLLTATSLFQIGETTSSDDHNLSLDRLAKDLKNVVHAAYGDHLPDIVLVGHRYSIYSVLSLHSL